MVVVHPITQRIINVVESVPEAWLDERAEIGPDGIEVSIGQPNVGGESVLCFWIADHRPGSDELYRIITTFLADWSVSGLRYVRGRRDQAIKAGCIVYG